MQPTTQENGLARHVARAYGKQISTARRISRYRRMLRAADAEDLVRISREARRREMVQRVTGEIVENLLVSGSDNPVVREVKRQLEHEFKTHFVFAYPPEEDDLQIFEEMVGGPPRKILGEEKGSVLTRLYQIALATVDDTML